MAPTRCKTMAYVQPPAAHPPPLWGNLWGLGCNLRSFVMPESGRCRYIATRHRNPDWLPRSHGAIMARVAVGCNVGAGDASGSAPLGMAGGAGCERRQRHGAQPCACASRSDARPAFQGVLRYGQGGAEGCNRILGPISLGETAPNS